MDLEGLIKKAFKLLSAFKVLKMIFVIADRTRNNEMESEADCSIKRKSWLVSRCNSAGRRNTTSNAKKYVKGNDNNMG